MKRRLCQVRRAEAGHIEVVARRQGGEAARATVRGRVLTGGRVSSDSG
jgi:hypothetical protein